MFSIMLYSVTDIRFIVPGALDNFSTLKGLNNLYIFCLHRILNFSPFNTSIRRTCFGRPSPKCDAVDI